MRFASIPRYTLVGGFCAAIYNACMPIGELFHVHYAITTTASFVIVALTGYVLHSTYTFPTPMSAVGLVRYAAAMAINLPLSIGLMFILHDLLRIQILLASLSITAALFALNYIASHWAVVGHLRSRTPGAQDAADDPLNPT